MRMCERARESACLWLLSLVNKRRTILAGDFGTESNSYYTILTIVCACVRLHALDTALLLFLSFTLFPTFRLLAPSLSLSGTCTRRSRSAKRSLVIRS